MSPALPGRYRISVAPARRGFELHRTVVHAAETKHGEVLDVVLVYAPGRFRALSRQGVERPQNLAGIEVDGGLCGELGIIQAWGALRVAVLVHVFVKYHPTEVGG